MRWLLLLLLLSVGAVVAIFVGYPQTYRTVGTPDQLTLYSLDFRAFEPGATVVAKTQLFHGYPILGKMEIAEAEQRLEIHVAVTNAIGGDEFAACFWPRHGLRVVQDGRITDYVICFHCSQVEIYRASGKKVEPISTAPKALLNKHLSEAGIPVVPDDEK